MKALLLFLIFSATTSVACAQDFLNSYHSYLIRRSDSSIIELKQINSFIKKLETLVRRTEVDNELKLTDQDSIYILSLYNIETGHSQLILWNSNFSCSYRHTFHIENGKIKKERLQIKTDDPKQLSELHPEIRRLVESADTAAYTSFAQKHLVLDGQSGSFTVGLNNHGKWRFITSNSYSVTFWKENL